MKIKVDTIINMMADDFASWATPARNYSRGNVFNNMPKYVQWI